MPSRSVPTTLHHEALALLQRDLFRTSDSAALLQKASEGCHRIHAQGIAEFRELHDVHATFSAFNLGDERLGVAQSFPEFDLRETRLLPTLPE